MRTEAEIRAERDRFKLEARQYTHERQRMEAWACATIVSALSWALGETSGPTVRVKLGD